MYDKRKALNKRSNLILRQRELLVGGKKCEGLGENKGLGAVCIFCIKE